MSLLMEACETGDVGVVQLALEGGADPNQADENNLTALHIASSNGHDEVVRVLLAAKATVNTQDTSGRSPLWSASFYGHLKCVELLIDAGANVDMQDEDGTTALYAAAQNGHLRVVEVLIAGMAQVDIQQKDGGTALHTACQNGHCEVVECLVERAHCDTIVKANNGMTPFHTACYNGHKDVVQYMVERAHCDTSVTDSGGCTPLDYAIQKGHTETIEYLQSLGAPSAAPSQSTDPPVDQQPQGLLNKLQSPTAIQRSERISRTVNVINTLRKFMGITRKKAKQLFSRRSKKKKEYLKNKSDQILAEREGLLPLGSYQDVSPHLPTGGMSQPQESKHSFEKEYLKNKSDQILAEREGLLPLGSYQDVILSPHLPTGSISQPQESKHSFGDIGEAVVEVTNKSNEFSNFGIKITVLENSLPKGINMCVLHVSFELSTDFEIPANSELVSSIYHVKCEPKVQFKKPVVLEIQYCASLSSDHQQRLVFARATDQSKQFEILEGGHFPIGERYGSIQLTRFSRLGVFIRKVFGFPIEKIYSALLFRKNLRCCYVIDTKCVICQDLDTHVKVIREALERDGFTKEMDLDQIQFENAVEMELHSENTELWTVTRITSTLSRDRIDGYSRVLDSNSRRGVVPVIHYRFTLKEKNISESVNFLLTKTDLDEESHRLILHIDLPQTLGTSDSATQRDSGECSGGASQKRRLSAGETSSTKCVRSSTQGTACDMGGAGLQELVDEYHVDTVKLDREIPDDDFPVIAAYFDGVDLYSQAMNLSAADQVTVRTILVQYNAQEAMAKCLSIWKSHYSYKVTFRALLELLLQRLNKVEVAVRVCRYLAQNHTDLENSSGDDTDYYSAAEDLSNEPDV